MKTGERGPQRKEGRNVETLRTDRKENRGVTGKPALALIAAWAGVFGGVGYAIGKKGDIEPFASYVAHLESDLKNHLERSGKDVRDQNAEWLRQNGVALAYEGNTIIANVTHSPRRIEIIPPDENTRYTSLRFDTKDLDAYFPDDKSPQGFFKLWFGSSEMEKIRTVSPAELLEEVLRAASSSNPEIQRVLIETFDADSMKKYFDLASKENAHIRRLIDNAKDPAAKAAAYYEIRLLHSELQHGGGRGQGIYRSTLEEMRTSFETMKHLLYPNAEQQRLIATHYGWNNQPEKLELFIRLTQSIGFEELGAIPATEMMPGDNWQRNILAYNKLMDTFGGEYCALLPTLSGTKKHPSSALGVWQNVESGAFKSSRYFRNLLMVEPFRVPDTHAEIFAMETSSNAMHEIVAYLDKWMHFVDLINRAGIERVSLLLANRHAKTRAELIGGLHYLPTPTKEAFIEWADETLKNDGELERRGQVSRTLYDFIPKPHRGQYGGPLAELAEYVRRSGAHAEALKKHFGQGTE